MLRGTSKSKRLVSEYEKALIGEHSKVNWSKLSKAEVEAEMKSLSGETATAVLEPKATKLVRHKNANDVFKILNFEQQAEVAKLKNKIGFENPLPHIFWPDLLRQ